MIVDMASLKKAMEHMDADDTAVAHAARDRAAEILSDARLDFAKLADLIEQRRLLLRPKILASIKRMDQPAMLGDAAFRDTGASLRAEGQSFRQIAEALELGGEIAPRHEEPAHRGELLHRTEFDSERDDPAPPLVTRLVSYPLRHPIRFILIAGLAFVLFNAVHDFTWTGWHFPGYRAGLGPARQRADTAISSASSSVRSPEAAKPQPPPAPTPSASPADQAAPSSPSAGPATSPAPSTAPTPSANESPVPAPSPTASAGPSAPVPPPSAPSRSQARGAAPSTSGANNAPRTVRSRIFDEFTPDRLRRNSRAAGPCIGGAGGCYWGGGQY